MIPGSIDPRRPDKVQRYKPPQTNGNAPAEDLTPDYMNILGKILQYVFKGIFKFKTCTVCINFLIFLKVLYLRSFMHILY